jgi:hypothetical protein
VTDNIEFFFLKYLKVELQPAAPPAPFHASPPPSAHLPAVPFPARDHASAPHGHAQPADVKKSAQIKFC